MNFSIHEFQNSELYAYFDVCSIIKDDQPKLDNIIDLRECII